MKCAGPCLVINITGRMNIVQTPDGTKCQIFKSFQIKPYFRSMNFNLNKFKAGNNNPPLFHMYLTEIIHPSDPSAWKVTDVKIKKLEGFMEINTRNIFCSENASPDSNILNSRFFLAVKDERTNKKLWKATCVDQGYKDAMKKSLLHKTSVSRRLTPKYL